MQKLGLNVADERDYQQLFKNFSGIVTRHHCGFWKDENDIKAAIFQKLPEWAQRDDLVGWVRGSEAMSPQVSEELARLSHENHELRSRPTDSGDYSGLSFAHIVKLLKDDTIPGEWSITDDQCRSLSITREDIQHVGDLLEVMLSNLQDESRSLVMKQVKDTPLDLDRMFRKLQMRGLIETIDDAYSTVHYILNEEGLRLRNRLLIEGNVEHRKRTLWRDGREKNA